MADPNVSPPIAPGTPSGQIDTHAIKNQLLKMVGLFVLTGLGSVIPAVIQFTGTLDLGVWGPLLAMVLTSLLGLVTGMLKEFFTDTRKVVSLLFMGLMLAAGSVHAQAPTPPVPPTPSPAPAPFIPPAIVIPDDLEPGDLIELSLIGCKSPPNLQTWICTPNKRTLLVIGGHPVFSAKVGTFTITMAGTIDGTQPPELVSQVVTIGQPSPTPTPTPTPTPGPTPPPLPTPVAAHLWLVTFDVALTRTPQQASFMTDTAYWNGLRSRGHNYAHLDAGNPKAVDYKVWIDKAGGPPCMVIIDADKKIGLDAIKLPADKAGVDAEVTRFTGGSK